MFKRIAVMVAVFLAACGTEKVSDDAGTGPVALPGSSIPVAAMANTTAVNAKIAVKTVTKVFQVATSYDGGSDTTTNLVCGDVACPTGSAAACQNGFCGTMVDQPTLFFVRNVPASQASINVPCDNRTYTIEVYGANATFQVQESHTASVTMTSPCSAAITPTWATKNFVATPALSGISFGIPDIYLGMAPPNDTFTVAVNGVAYPFAVAGWTLAVAPSLPVVARGNLATYTVASNVSASSFAFTGTFPLDPSLTVAEDLPNGRWFIPVNVSKTPVAAGTVNLP